MRKKIAATILTAVPAAILAGCGYAPPAWRGGDDTTLAVEAFDNRTLRRGTEQQLYQAVVREIVSSTPYRLASPDRARYVLRGTLADYSEPTLVEGEKATVVSGSVEVRLTLTLVDRETGGAIFRDRARTESAAVVPARGETEESGRAEAFDRLARWTVRQLQAPW